MYHSVYHSYYANCNIIVNVLFQVERFWDMLLASCTDVQSALSMKDDRGLGPLASLRRRDVNLTMVLQLMTKAKEVNRLKRIRKEFEEFVPIATDKRYRSAFLLRGKEALGSRMIKCRRSNSWNSDFLRGGGREE